MCIQDLLKIFKTARSKEEEEFTQLIFRPNLTFFKMIFSIGGHFLDNLLFKVIKYS